MSARATARKAPPAKRPAQKLALSRGTVVGPGGRVGQFWTPGWLARVFVRWMGIRRGTRVLDAGVGMGALSIAAADAGGIVRGAECDERIVERVTPHLERRGITLVHRDFLAPLDHRQMTIETGVAHDVSISNPPWEDDYPERFLERMLTFAPRAGAIVPLNILCGVERARFWEHVAITRLRALPRRPIFSGSSGGKRDVVLLEVASRGVPRRSGDVDLAEIGVGE